MRILKIIPQAFYTARGTPLSAYHRARELVARGHEVDILTYGVGDDPPDLKARVFRARGPHFTRSIRAGPSRLKIWFDCLLFVNLLVRLMRGRYDLLYAHEEGALLARFAGAIFRIPYVYDMHSSLPLQITDWKFSRNRSVIAAFRWVERASVQGACAVVAISPAVERAAKNVCPDARCVVIVNHFEMDSKSSADDVAAVRARYGIGPQHKLVLYTGSFVALQALDLLLDAVPLVLARVPNAVFLLVGGTDEEIALLNAQAQRLGIADSVLLERSQPQQVIPGYLAAADALVSPRTQGINPPGKLLPYLASGRPVVATDTLVHNQLLTDKCAILTRPDAAGLAEGLIVALTDPIRTAEVVKEAGQLLTHYCSKTARDAAYADVLAAANAASGRRRVNAEPPVSRDRRA
jgi:glycosyltransferase involved in cell wall biosynthesis